MLYIVRTKVVVYSPHLGSFEPPSQLVLCHSTKNTVTAYAYLFFLIGSIQGPMAEVPETTFGHSTCRSISKRTLTTQHNSHFLLRTETLFFTRLIAFHFMCAFLRCAAMQCSIPLLQSTLNRECPKCLCILLGIYLISLHNSFDLFALALEVLKSNTLSNFFFTDLNKTIIFLPAHPDA